MHPPSLRDLGRLIAACGLLLAKARGMGGATIEKQESDRSRKALGGYSSLPDTELSCGNRKRFWIHDVIFIALTRKVLMCLTRHLNL